MGYVEVDLDKLLQAVEKYIDEHFVPDSGIRQFKEPPSSSNTGKALKTIIKTVLNLKSKTFSERLTTLIDKRGYKPADVYRPFAIYCG